MSKSHKGSKKDILGSINDQYDQYLESVIDLIVPEQFSEIPIFDPRTSLLISKRVSESPTVEVNKVDDPETIRIVKDCIRIREESERRKTKRRPSLFERGIRIRKVEKDPALERPIEFSEIINQTFLMAGTQNLEELDGKEPDQPERTEGESTELGEANNDTNVIIDSAYNTVPPPTPPKETKSEDESPSSGPTIKTNLDLQNRLNMSLQTYGLAIGGLALPPGFETPISGSGQTKTGASKKVKIPSFVFPKFPDEEHTESKAKDETRQKERVSQKKEILSSILDAVETLTQKVEGMEMVMVRLIDLGDQVSQQELAIKDLSAEVINMRSDIGAVLNNTSHILKRISSAPNTRKQESSPEEASENDESTKKKALDWYNENFGDRKWKGLTFEILWNMIIYGGFEKYYQKFLPNSKIDRQVLRRIDNKTAMRSDYDIVDKDLMLQASSFKKSVYTKSGGSGVIYTAKSDQKQSDKAPERTVNPPAKSDKHSKTETSSDFDFLDKDDSD